MRTKKSLRSKRTKSIRVGLAVCVLIALLLCLNAFFNWTQCAFDYMGGMCSTLQVQNALTVENILVSGRERAPRQDIIEALDVQSGTPILDVDLVQAQKRLEQNPWVLQARIERHLPQTLKIYMKERRPIGRYQLNQQIYVLGEGGVIMPLPPSLTYQHMPLFVGKDANVHAEDLLQEIKAFPPIQSMFVSAVWVGDRRWNILLNNGWTVRLPEKNVKQALFYLEKALNTHSIVSQNIDILDLRLPKQMVLVYRTDKKTHE